MKRYELKIDILDVSYIDPLIVCLARQGYAPYYNAETDCEHGAVYIEIPDVDLTTLADDARVKKGV